MSIDSVRPPDVLRLFWLEQIVIEETARFLEPVYFWEMSHDQKGVRP